MKTTILEIEGKRDSIAGHCRRYGVAASNVDYYVRKGYTHAQAILLIYDNRIKRVNLAKAARDAGFTPDTVRRRVRNGLSLAEALSIPVLDKRFEMDGIFTTAKAHCLRYGINYQSFNSMKGALQTSPHDTLEIMIAKRRSKNENRA